MLHAMTVSATYWRKVTDALEGSYDLLMPDLPFHGQTGDLPDAARHSHDETSEMLRELVETTCEPPVNVVGHSYGGACAITFVLQHPDLVNRVLLIEPSVPTVLLEAGEQELMTDFLEMGERFDQFVEKGEPEEAWRVYIDAQSGDGTWHAMPDEKKQRILGTTMQAYAVGKATKGNSLKLADLRSFNHATMMIVGDKSPPRHRRTAEILRDHIPGCALTIIPGAAHMSPGSHPCEIADVIDKHFS